VPPGEYCTIFASDAQNPEPPRKRRTYAELFLETYPNDVGELKLSNNERVNGFQLFDALEPLMPLDAFEDLVDTWQSATNFPTFEEFLEVAETDLCTDWYKMDVNGEAFGSVYYQGNHDQAFLYTGRENMLALYRLPYPDTLLLEVARMGCSLRQESVRDLNFLCVWLERKYAQVHPDKPPLPRKSPCFSKTFDGMKFLDLPVEAWFY